MTIASLRSWSALGAALAVATLVAACGSAGVAPTPSSSAKSTAVTSQPEAEAFSALLWRFQHAGLSWAYEPRGDVPEDKGGAAGTLVYAHVDSMNRDGHTVSFDAWQYFAGTSAKRQYERDHPGQGGPPGARYGRNRYVHVETLPYADDCLVAVGYGKTKTVPASELSFGKNDSPGFFWLVVQGGRVTAMAWQPTNE